MKRSSLSFSKSSFSVALIIIIIVYTHSSLCDAFQSNSTPKSSRKNQDKEPSRKDHQLGPCHLCREVVKSFEKAIYEVERTVELKGRPEASLETPQDRVIRIERKLCQDLPRIKDQCLQLAATYKPHIYQWYLKERSSIRLFQYLCIEKAEVCCPEGHYGPECKPCLTNRGLICSGHGICIGNGTRKGSGKCKCQESHTGELCRKCALGYFSLSDKDGLNECERCHRSCMGHCSNRGPKGCKRCKPGYSWDSDYGCFDVDECTELTKNPCGQNTFCVNTEGSYTCFECDRACDGCHSDGPDNCVKCAEDFTMKDGVCVATKTKADIHLETSRYWTYCGLCVATCIIFRNNIPIASGIGLLVALYISAAEYTVRDTTGIPSIFERVLANIFSWF